MITFSGDLRVVIQKAMDLIYLSHLLSVQIRKCSLCAHFASILAFDILVFRLILEPRHTLNARSPYLPVSISLNC